MASKHGTAKYDDIRDEHRKRSLAPPSKGLVRSVQLVAKRALVGGVLWYIASKGLENGSPWLQTNGRREQGQSPVKPAPKK